MSQHLSTMAIQALFAISTVGMTLAGDSWNQFRGPTGQGAIEGGNPPVSWSSEKNVSWRTELPGQGWSSPVVQNDIIYVTAAIPTDDESDAYSLSLLVINAVTGDLIRRHRVIQQSASDLKKIHSKNSHASPTPIIEGDRIYLHFGHQGTACCDLAGNVLWVNRELSFPPVHGGGGSPVVVGKNLIFTCDGAKEPFVASLNKDSGELLWKCDRPIDAKKKFSFCTPTQIVVQGQVQVIAPGSDCVLALDPSDGSIIWQVGYDGYSVVPKPLYAGGLLFVCTGFDRGSILAIDPSGRGDVTETNVEWQLDRGVPKTPSLIVHDELLFFISDGGVAMCLEASTGERVWQQRVGGKYSASPVICRDRIYFTSESGVTTVVSAQREYRELGKNAMEEKTLASLAAVDDALIMRTEKALYRIE